MLHEALRLLRVFNDIKSKDFASMLEISPSFLSEIEHGKKEPSLELIRKYAKIFNTTPSSILWFSEDIEGKRKIKNLKKILVKKTISFLQSIENAQKS